MSAVITPRNGLRQMVEDDLETVVKIESASYPFPWTFGIFHDCLHVGYTCRVYEIDNEVVAYAVMSIGAGEAHILTLVVREDCRKSGLGNMFMKNMLLIAKQHHVETMLLEVRPSNLNAIRLYRTLGFNELGVRPDYYPAENGREDALIMALHLDLPTSLHSV